MCVVILLVFGATAATRVTRKKLTNQVKGERNFVLQNFVFCQPMIGKNDLN